ncbi:MAG TPA: alanine dehydrogenase [Anaerolineae bacterium]|nr:alanine dehydrogenase [Anaerolineae bacterium]
MHEEASELRAFLPDFIHKLTKTGFEVHLEEEYGTTNGFNFNDYKLENATIHSCNREEVFQKDYVLIVRSPHDDEFNLIGEKSCLIAMLHFPTRPSRVALLQEMGIQAISLDGIVNDFHIRIVENMKAVAWNGLEVAFNELEKKWPNLLREDHKPWQVLVIGTGMVGMHTIDAASKFGRLERNNEHINLGGSGVLVTAIGRNVTYQGKHMKHLLEKTDVLVDATQRTDPSKPVVPNNWIAWLPEHAIIVDLSVDPYLLVSNPQVVKGIEGIPEGNLDKYVFASNDPDWDKTVPASIPSKNRRTTITCYSWPGIHAESCMRHYAQQLLPLMLVLYNKNYRKISANGSFFERALFRAKLDTFMNK